MGIIDRDYYREGTDAEVKTRKRHQPKQASSSQFSALCIHCNASIDPSLEVCPNCKKWQYKPVASEVAGQQYYPTQPQQPQRQMPPQPQYANIGWTPYGVPEKRGVPAPVLVSIIGLLVIVCLLLAVIAALVAKGSPTTSTQNQIAFEPTAIPTVVPRPTLAAQPTSQPPSNSTLFVQPTVAPVVAQQQAAPTLASVPNSSNFITGRVGQPIQGPGYLLSVNSGETSSGYSDFAKAKPGKMFVSVDVTIESQQNKGISANSFYAKVVDLQGFSYPEAFSGKEPSFPVQSDMAIGQKARGWITFEVPQNATGLSFRYSILDFSNQMTLSVPLN